MLSYALSIFSVLNSFKERVRKGMTILSCFSGEFFTYSLEVLIHGQSPLGTRLTP